MGYTVGHKWTNKDKSFLKANFIQKTDGQLAESVGVSKSAVDHKLRLLGLKRPFDISRKRATEAMLRVRKRDKVIITCIECGKPLPALLPCFARIRRFCSKSCGSKYLHKYPSVKTIQHRKEFGKRVAKHPKRLEEMQKVAKMENWLKGRTGENSPTWQGGISFEPYSPEFNKKFKKHVRMLWANQCFLYKKSEDLTVHHIDYNKKNTTIYNTVVLCRACNSKVNYNRTYWQKYLHGICWGSPEEKKIAELMQHNKNFV